MSYILNISASSRDPFRGSEPLSGMGSGSNSTFSERTVPEDFGRMVKDQLREILEDLFQQYNRMTCDQKAQDRNLLIKQICLITKLYYESNDISRSRSKNIRPLRGEDEDTDLLTDDLNSLFRECMEVFIGNITDIVQELTILPDEAVRMELLEKIAQNFDESFAPFTKLSGESDE